MTELVEGSLIGREAAAAPPIPRPTRARWRDAAIVLGLSVFFPGCGHAYARRWVRASLWSLFFVVVVFPAAIFAFAVWSSFSRSALPGIAATLLLLSLACALGPAIDALRGRLFDDAQGRHRSPASIGALASYSAAFTVLLGIEAVWFLAGCLESRKVETSRLAPLVSAGSTVTVLRSGYLRPVHGDIILSSVPAPGETTPGETVALAPEALARVVATPRDTIQVRQGKLLVDGVEIDLRKNDQRLGIERAGRAERRRQLLPGSKPSSDGLRVGFQLDWAGSEWGPHVIPEALWLVVLDVGEMDVGPEEGPAPPSRGILVGKEHILGRALLGAEAR
jgi:hypothetical protein